MIRTNKLPKWLTPNVMLLVLLMPLPALANSVIKNDIIVHYSNVASDKLALDIRPSGGKTIDKVSAQIGGIDLPVSAPSRYPSTQQTTAILFLVDTSDPRRQDAIDNNIQHIDQLLEFQQPHYRYALARFDSELEFLTPFGVSPDTIRQQARSLTAVGRTTELFRNTLGALKQLSRYPADRKFLFLLSDGRAEDRAYFHRDVVKAAVKDDISIFTIGYADTVKLTVELQILRRMSEDTGGQYMSTEPRTFQLQNSNLQRMFDAIDFGSQYSIDLSQAFKVGIREHHQLALSVTAGATLTQINLPIQLPTTAVSRTIQPQTSPTTLETNDTAAPQVIIQRIPSAEINPSENLYWLLVGLSALMIIFMIYLVISLRGRVPNGTAVSNETESANDAYAWLVSADDQSADAQRFAIRGAETKIGRYRGNDIALHDYAISRYHAEIHFTDDGGFVITDMGSKNGLLVNDTEVLEQRLSNNDIIEIGDIRLRLEIPEELADDMQDTQMFRTQFPNQRA